MARKVLLVALDSLMEAGMIWGTLTVLGLPLTLGAGFLIPALIAGLYVAGQYDEFHPRELSSALGVSALVGVALLGTEVGAAILGVFPMNWGEMLLVSGISVMGIGVWRLVFRVWITRFTYGEPVILIGDGNILADGWRAIRRAPHLLVDVVVDDPNPKLWIAAIEERLRERGSSRILVVVGFNEPLTDLQSAALVRLRRLGADIVPMRYIVESLEERIPISLARGDSLDGWERTQQAGHEVSLRVKRILDIIGVLVLGFILGIPTLVAGIATHLYDGGPALYRQRRVGKDGHIFEIVKIRSMVIEAEQASGAVWSADQDPRVTPIGRFLRTTRLDEVPQLWNVLTGNMSLVGPRPERPEFTDRLAEEIPLYDSRHIVSPGLTGWAQVRLPYGASVSDSIAKLEYDLYYIRHWSLWFDLRILLRTVGVVLARKGGR
jgi:exopolysaccharide biosynthesis polyprenyl glycosylphosphotransferase